MIDEFVSLVNPVLFEPPFPPEGSRVPRPSGQTPARFPRYDREGCRGSPLSRTSLGLPDRGVGNADQERERPKGYAERYALAYAKRYPLGLASRRAPRESKVFNIKLLSCFEWCAYLRPRPLACQFLFL